MKREKRGKGSGSRPGTPHQRADGRWVQYITDEDGKRHKRTGASKQDVRDKITALRAELKSGGRRKVRELGPTFEELCTQLLSAHDADGSTYRVYANGLMHWRRLLGDATRQAAITGEAIQTAIDDLATRLEPKTVATYYAPLRLALGADHPALKKISLPKKVDVDDDDHEPYRLVPSALAERLQAAAQHHPMGIALGLGFGAGTRAGEAVALRWQDIDWAHGQISINGSIKPTRTGWIRGKTKSGKARSLTVSSDLMAWLATHRRIQADTAALVGYPTPEYVIADLETGQRMTRIVPTNVLRKLLAEVCTPEEHAIYGDLKYHALRHTHISGLLSQGAGIPDVARRAGHTPETLVRHYAHAIPGADRQLAALAGELFPVLSSEATLQATLPDTRHSSAARLYRPTNSTYCGSSLTARGMMPSPFRSEQ